MIFVTGGAGFIGSNFVPDWLAQSDEPVPNFDKLTYGGNLNNLAALKDDARHVRVDICEGEQVSVDTGIATVRQRKRIIPAGAPGTRLAPVAASVSCRH